MSTHNWKPMPNGSRIRTSGDRIGKNVFSPDRDYIFARRPSAWGTAGSSTPLVCGRQGELVALSAVLPERAGDCPAGGLYRLRDGGVGGPARRQDRRLAQRNVRKRSRPPRRLL